MAQVQSSSPQAPGVLVNPPRDGSRFSREVKRSILSDFSATGTRLKERTKQWLRRSRPNLARPAVTSGGVLPHHWCSGHDDSQSEVACGDDDDQVQTGCSSNFYVFTCAPTNRQSMTDLRVSWLRNLGSDWAIGLRVNRSVAGRCVSPWG